MATKTKTRARPPKVDTPRQSFRCPPELWEETMDNAYAEGKTLTEVLIAQMVAYNKRQDRKAQR